VHCPERCADGRQRLGDRIPARLTDPVPAPARQALVGHSR
jgi:hypothetical protein